MTFVDGFLFALGAISAVLVVAVLALWLAWWGSRG